MRPDDMNKQVASLRVGVRTRPLNAPPPTPGPRESVGFATMDLHGPLEGWSLEAEFRLDGGEVIHGPVTFRPSEGERVPMGSLGASALRQLSLSTVLANFEDLMRRIEAAAPGGPVRGWVDALTAGRKPGRRGQDPSVYLLWAQRRVQAEEAAPGRAIKWMVEQWGDLYSEGAINKYVYTAREKGFLTPASELVDLTEQARRLLTKGVTDGNS